MAIRAKKRNALTLVYLLVNAVFSIFAELSLNALKMRFLQHGLGAMRGFAVHFWASA